MITILYACVDRLLYHYETVAFKWIMLKDCSPLPSGPSIYRVKQIWPLFDATPRLRINARALLTQYLRVQDHCFEYFGYKIILYNVWPPSPKLFCLIKWLIPHKFIVRLYHAVYTAGSAVEHMGSHAMATQLFLRRRQLPCIVELCQPAILKRNL